MSVLIKGMKMPKEGLSVVVDLWNNGKAYVYGTGNSEMYEAVELPDHGDLIDRDVVADALDLMAVHGRLRDAFDMVMSCEAVIPAERSENETDRC